MVSQTGPSPVRVAGKIAGPGISSFRRTHAQVGHRRWNDCEDRGRSTASMTPGMTGEYALLRPVRSWLPAPARLEGLA